MSLSNQEFSGQIALVTGAAAGIGAAVADLLLAQGAELALIDRDAEGLQQQARDWQARYPERRIRLFPLDVRDGAALAQVVDEVESQLGPIEVLVNVAGVLFPGDTLSLDDEAWENSFAINTTAVFRLCRAVARRMQPRGRGSIVTVSSNAAHVPRLGMTAYAASKAATTHFMRCLALELAPSGIRCNTVSPGSTDTPMQQAFAPTPEHVAAVLRGNLDRYRLGIPLGRIASPQDIAEAVCFLASSRARHITLHDLVIDGGATLGV